MKGLWLALVLLSTSANAEQVVHLGLASNFSEASSSSSNPYGDYFRNGVQLALKESEARLRQHGLRIELEEFDYGTRQIRVLEAAKKAAASQVIGVLGYNFSSHALLAAPIHQQAKLPMLTPSATADRVAQMGAYVHMGCFDNSLMGRTLAKIATERLKAKRSAIVVAADCSYCLDLARAFRDELQKHGGGITSEVQVLETDRDFTPAIQKLKAVEYDVVLVPNQELNSARIISAALRAGIRKPFLGGDGWGNVGAEFFGVLGQQDLKGYSVSHWHEDLRTQRSNRFVKQYRAAFHKSPNDTSVLAYDSMLLMVEAVLKAKTLTRAGLEASFQSIEYFEGVTGKAYFAPGKAPEKTLVVLEANQSRFKVVGAVDPGGIRK